MLNNLARYCLIRGPFSILRVQGKSFKKYVFVIIKYNYHIEANSLFFLNPSSSLFLNSESLFYYARHARSGGKALSVEEIRALLAPPVKEEKAEPTLQVTTIAESTAQEIESGTTINLDTSFENCSRNDRKVRSHPDNTELTTILEQHDGPQSDPHPTTHSPQSPHPTTNSPQSPHPTTHSPQSGPHTATDDSEVHESTVPAKFPSTSTAPSASTRVAFASEVDTRHGGTYQTSPVDKDGTADGTQEGRYAGIHM